jgi:hypothetical protein
VGLNLESHCPVERRNPKLYIDKQFLDFSKMDINVDIFNIISSKRYGMYSVKLLKANELPLGTSHLDQDEEFFEQKSNISAKNEVCYR